MARRSRRQAARRKPAKPRAPRLLRVEVLESRTVLSALAPAAPALRFGPPLRDWLPALVDAGPMMRLNSAQPDLASGMEAERGNALARSASRAAEGGMIDVGIAPGARHDAVFAGPDPLAWLQPSTGLDAWNHPDDLPPLAGIRPDFPADQAGQDRPVDSLPDWSFRFPEMLAPPEGDLFVVEAPSFGRRYRAIGPLSASLAMAESSVTPQTSAPSSTPSAAPNVAILESAPLSESPFSGTEGETNGFRWDVPGTSNDAVAPIGGGPAALSAYNPSIATERNPGWSSPAGAGSASAMEGGLIELGIAPDSPSRLLRRTQEAPAEQSRWNAVSGSALEPAGKRGDEEAESRDGLRIAGEDHSQAVNRSAASDRSKEAASDSGQNSGSAEGGTIELAAAFFSPAGSSSVPEAGPRAADGNPLPRVHEIRIDHGVALFHAFELATAPAEGGDSADLAPIEAGPMGPPPESPAPTPDSPAAAKAARAQKSEDEPGQRVPMVRAIVVASLIVAAEAAKPAGRLWKAVLRHDDIRISSAAGAGSIRPSRP